jgi:hypothetical protein
MRSVHGFTAAAANDKTMIGTSDHDRMRSRKLRQKIAADPTQPVLIVTRR